MSCECVYGWGFADFDPFWGSGRVSWLFYVFLCLSCLWKSILMKVETCIFWIGLTNGNGSYLSIFSMLFSEGKIGHPWEGTLAVVPRILPHIALYIIHPLYTPQIPGICWYISRVLPQRYPTFPLDIWGPKFSTHDFPAKGRDFFVRKTRMRWMQRSGITTSSKLPFWNHGMDQLWFASLMAMV